MSNSYIPSVVTTRHDSVFNASTYNTPIHIIGVGATGSFIAYMLAKLGINGSLITIHDFDTVGAHNIANQMFSNSDVGKLKVKAVQDRLLAETGSTLVNTSDKPVTSSTTGLSGYVFLAVDNMAARETIVKLSETSCLDVRWFFESRLGLHDYTVHAWPSWDNAKWRKTWYPDSEVSNVVAGACQTQQTLGPTAMAAAALLVNAFMEVNGSNSTAFRRYYSMKMGFGDVAK